MERLRNSKLSFQSFAYYHSRSIAPNATHSTAPLFSERFNQCKLHLPLIHHNLKKSCGFASSSHVHQRFAAGSLIKERFSKSRGFSSSSHVRLNFSPNSKPRRYFSLFLKLIAAVLLVPVVYLGFQYFRHVKKVPYTNGKCFMLNSGHEDRMLGDKMLEKKKVDKVLGEILPVAHPHSVKVCSILKKLLDALQRDFGFTETPVVTYHGDSAT